MKGKHCYGDNVIHLLLLLVCENESYFKNNQITQLMLPLAYGLIPSDFPTIPFHYKRKYIAFKILLSS